MKMQRALAAWFVAIFLASALGVAAQPNGGAAGGPGPVNPCPGNTCVLLGVYAISTTGGSTALSQSALQVATVAVSGALASNATLTLPAALAGTWAIVNETSNLYSVAVAVSGQSAPALTIPQGQSRIVSSDGSTAYSPVAEASALSTPTVTVSGDVACWSGVLGNALVDCGTPPIQAFTQVIGGSNVSLFGSVAGTGAFALQAPTGTPTGGNARGNGAVDLQVLRYAANQVASGGNSFLAGNSSSATGSGSVAIAYNSSVSGTGAVAIGYQNLTVSGVGSWARGQYVTDRGRAGADCWSGAQFSAAGDQQTCVTTMSASTSSTTATRMTVDGSAAGSGNCNNIPDNTVYVIDINGAGHDQTSGAYAGFVAARMLLYRGSGAGTTTLTIQNSGTEFGTAGASIAWSADTTNGCLNASVTAPNSDAWHWVIRANNVEVQ